AANTDAFAAVVFALYVSVSHGYKPGGWRRVSLLFPSSEEYVTEIKPPPPLPCMRSDGIGGLFSR
ncbi:MAG: hypothetical protein AAB281_02585, partial [Actinomycetota bacterium]